MSRIRLAAVGLCFALAWLLLWIRAFQVQILDGPELADMARRQHLASENILGERGNILDRNNRLLAKSVKFKSVFVRPVEVEEPGAAAKKLSGVLGLPERELLEKIGTKGNFVWLARQVGDKKAAAIKEAGLAGVHLTTEYGRQYPNKNLAGKLLGFVGLDEKGLEGLELAFNDHLAGRRSRFAVQRDAAGRKLHMKAAEMEADVRGLDLRLTLDANVQFLVQEALAKAVEQSRGRWGGAMLVKVDSGEILAWAEYPPFNPNDYQGRSPNEWRNGLAIDAFEPGSTIKPLLVAAALQEGACEHDSIYFCEKGKWRVEKKTIKDTHAYDWLPVNKVVRYSSNIGSAKIAMDLGRERYYAYLTRLGFGKKTGLGLPGEGKGILRTPGEWTELDLAAAAFGQGFSCTVPQLAKGFLCLANKGVLKPLRLIQSPPVVTGVEMRIFEEATARRVLSMMEEVVQEDGTGKAARIGGLRIGGKTGTAQKVDPETGLYGDRYCGSFVGFIPADEPRFLVVVMVDEPKTSHYGGVVAAPAFKEIGIKTLAYLGELPDPALADESADPAETALAGRDEPGPAAIEDEDKYLAGPESEDHKVRAQGEPGLEAGKSASNRKFVRGVQDAGKVPNVIGLPLRRAVELFVKQGAAPRVKGDGMVVSRQSPPPGAKWPKNKARKCVLWLARESG